MLDNIGASASAQECSTELLSRNMSNSFTETAKSKQWENGFRSRCQVFVKCLFWSVWVLDLKCYDQSRFVIFSEENGSDACLCKTVTMLK